MVEVYGHTDIIVPFGYEILKIYNFMRTEKYYKEFIKKLMGYYRDYHK